MVVDQQNVDQIQCYFVKIKIMTQHRKQCTSVKRVREAVKKIGKFGTIDPNF